MSQTLVSVIIPAYQPGDYIYECLDSLCRQTLSKDSFEAIVVLNGPREPFFTSIETYAAKNAGRLSLRLLYSGEKGVSAARNCGIDAANGQYLTFIDDDDWVSDTYLETLLANAGNPTIAASDIQAVEDGTGYRLSYYITEAYRRLPHGKPLPVFTTRSFLSSICGKLIPREAIGGERLITSLALGEDALFAFALSKNIKGVTLAAPRAVYYVRIRTASASRRHYSYSQRVGVAIKVSYHYTRLYLRSPLRYNLPFFLSRIVATLRKLTQRNYEVTPVRLGSPNA